MQNDVYDIYEPRNEEQMVELFEGLLFMRFGDYLDEETRQESEKRMRFTESEVLGLAKDGLLNRIFRRWMQVTWGEQQVSDCFYGETPRQELSRIRPDLVQGRGYLSIKPKQNSKQFKLVPCYYNEDVFSLAFKNLNGSFDKIVAPNFDKEFSAFIGQLELFDESLQKKNWLEPESVFGKFLNLFWHNAPALFLVNCQAISDKEKFVLAVDEVKNVLLSFCRSQKSEANDYLKIDEIFDEIWEVLRKYNTKLPPLRHLIEEKEMGKNLAENKDFKKAVEILYRLGVAFDRYILFPLDRYFGGAEIVWLDQRTFLGEFAATLSLLRDKNQKSELKKNKTTLDVGDIVFDLRYLWFTPPAYFRLFGPVFQYLR